MSSITKSDGTVNSPKGFMSAAFEANVKYSGRNDMAMVYSKDPCTSAGVFTSNVVKAAPVMWDKQIVAENKEVHAIIVNSGIANACTGKEGMEICAQSAQAVSDALGINADGVIIGSTGVIGPQIPIDKIKKGVKGLSEKLSGTKKSGIEAAEAIMTTDTHSKHMSLDFEIGGKLCHMGLMAKGSGMIHPNMCTMLCYITTDVKISQPLMQKALKTVVIDTFNMISVDGDMSTNDTLMVISNGRAGNKLITTEDDDYKTFLEALNIACTETAMQLAGDGEGATALFEVKVVNSDTKENARTLAQSVIGSNLTKAAIYGHDANIGRIICALGYSGVMFDPEKVDLTVQSCAGEMLIFANGRVISFDEDKAKEILSQKKVTAIADMKMGCENATAWGCDLTYDYVKINADYRS